jgi:hypothetical protein
MNIENNSEIEAVAFKNINNSISIVLLNTHENDVKFNLNIDNKSFYISAKKNSIMTIVI